MYVARENLSFQYCNHFIDCSVQCAVGTRNSEAAVLHSNKIGRMCVGVCSLLAAPDLGDW